MDDNLAGVLADPDDPGVVSVHGDPGVVSVHSDPGVVSVHKASEQELGVSHDASDQEVIGFLLNQVSI